MQGINDNDDEQPCCFTCGKSEADGVTLRESDNSLAKLISSCPMICSECVADLDDHIKELRKLGPTGAIRKVQETLREALGKHNSVRNTEIAVQILDLQGNPIQIPSDLDKEEG